MVAEGEEAGSGASSPKNKVKFLCSHGGKVLPRPSDGILKYVGGETRVISLPRTVTFSELMKKVSGMMDGGENVVLKYQVVPEDLDALVSVRNDEDVKHMIEEHDRHESGGAPMLRAFLFPSKPVVVAENLQVATAASEAYLLEQQRYIDAINGIIRTSPKARLSPIRPFCTSSTCSSPKSTSPDGHIADLVFEPPSSPFHGHGHAHAHAHGHGHAHAHAHGRLAMHRVRSSPSITSLSNLHTIQQQHDHHSHYQNQSLHHHPPTPPTIAAYPSVSRAPPPPQDPQPQVPVAVAAAAAAAGGGLFGMGRPPPIMSLGKTDVGSRSNNNGSGSGGGGYNNYYYTTTSSTTTSTCRAPKGYGYYDDSAAVYGNVMVERVSSMPLSPRKSSIWE